MPIRTDDGWNFKLKMQMHGYDENICPAIGEIRHYDLLGDTAMNATMS